MFVCVLIFAVSLNLKACFVSKNVNYTPVIVYIYFFIKLGSVFLRNAQSSPAQCISSIRCHRYRFHK